jgi:hypothetical protein
VRGDETPRYEVIIRRVVDLDDFAILGQHFATLSKAEELRNTNLRDEWDDARHDSPPIRV